MTDLSGTIEAKSDQLNSDDLMGGPRTIRVTGVKLLGDEQPIAINYEGDRGKPYKPCKSMRRVLVWCWGPDGKAYAGRSMTLFRDPEVSWGGSKVGGIRISHMSHIEKPETMALTATRGNKKPWTVKPLTDAPKAAPGPEFDVDAFTREVEAKCAAATDPDALKAWANSDEVMAKRNQVKAANADRAAFIRTTIGDRIGTLSAGDDV